MSAPTEDQFPDVRHCRECGSATNRVPRSPWKSTCSWTWECPVCFLVNGPANPPLSSAKDFQRLMDTKHHCSTVFSVEDFYVTASVYTAGLGLDTWHPLTGNMSEEALFFDEYPELREMIREVFPGSYKLDWREARKLFQGLYPEVVDAV